MNNKYVKYFLIVAVVGVWAAIIYRVAHGLSGPPLPHIRPGVAGVKEYKQDEDTFHLYADYPDPFLGSADSSIENSVIRPATSISQDASTQTDKAITAEMIATIIQYNGIISNLKKRSTVAIVTVRGKEYLVREKDRVEEITIRKIEKTRLSISYKGENYIITK